MSRRGFQLVEGLAISKVIHEIRQWKARPRLANLVRDLESAAELDRFLDHWAEAMIARRLLNFGCQVDYEPNVGGQRPDFRVSREGQQIFAHIKRLNRESLRRGHSNFEHRLLTLKKIDKPFLVVVEVSPNLRNERSARVADEAACVIIRKARSFLELAQIGESIEIKDANEKPLAKVIVLGKYPDHVCISVDFGMREVSDRDRLCELMERAYEKFVPNELNIIFVTGDFTIGCWEDNLRTFEDVLLGNTCCHYQFNPDRLTLLGVKSGRISDGFWSGDRHAFSQATCCFRFELTREELKFRFFIRQDVSAPPPQWLAEMFSVSHS